MGKGEIIIEPGANVWPHELKTAEALAHAGHSVRFVRASQGQRVTAADIVMGGVVWDMKAPTVGTRKALERNLRRAARQSSSIIVDSQRIRSISDAQVERELRKLSSLITAVRRLLFVNRKCEVITIK